MEGYKSLKDNARGIIPRAVEDIYKRIEEWNSQKVRHFPSCSFIVAIDSF